MAETIETVNNSANAVWITIYNDLGTQTDWGCLAANSSRTWASGDYLQGQQYKLRGEVKPANDCSDQNNIYDTETTFWCHASNHFEIVQGENNWYWNQM